MARADKKAGMTSADSRLERAMDIELSKVGKIMAGQELGRYVKVVDDAASTGGFLILTATAPDMQDGFDSWVESREMLERFFEEAGWIVEWQH